MHFLIHQREFLLTIRGVHCDGLGASVCAAGEDDVAVEIQELVIF